MKKPMFHRLAANASELADLMGVDRSSIRRWQKLSHAPKDLELIAWVQWYALHKAGHFETNSYIEERARHERARRERTELLLAKERGEIDLRVNYENALREVLAPTDTFLTDLPDAACVECNPDNPELARQTLVKHRDSFRKAMSKRRDSLK